MSLNIKEFNGKKYIIKAFKGRKGLQLKVRLLKVASPMLEDLQLLGDADDTKSNDAIFKLIKKLVEETDTDEVLSILEELMTCVSTENGDVDFDTEFQKNYVSLYKLSAEVKAIKASTYNGSISISLDGIFKPVKAKIGNANKANNNLNLSNKIFTNFVNAEGDQIAYSDGYDEEQENLYVEASTFNGTISIN